MKKTILTLLLAVLLLPLAAQDVEKDHCLMERIEKAIRDNDYDTVKPLFAEEAYDCFLKLIPRGDARIVGEPEYRFSEFGQLTLCRGLVLMLNLKNSNPYIGEVVFRFNTDNLIESIAFRLSSKAENDIMKNEQWELDSRLALITFLEDYQTAYTIGRIEYIGSVYDDKSFIYNLDSISTPKGIQGEIKYDTLSKEQYINRLKRIFSNKEYINFNIKEIEVKQSVRDKDLFGIRVKQEYFSNVYDDSGYLFMLVDIRGGSPAVLVSVWQNDGVPLDSLFGLDDIY